MVIPTVDLLRSKLVSTGKDVHFLRVTQDAQAMVCRCTHAAFSGVIEPYPLLMIHLCVAGGGPVAFQSDLQSIEDDLCPGSIGVIPPNARIEGFWPAMTAITFGISVTSVSDTFGQDWACRLKSEVLSRVFRDPLVEATMLDMGSTRAGTVSDAGLVHAAQMIAHQLLDQPGEDSASPRNETPLGKVALARIDKMIEENLNRHVSVEEMADLAGMSRHHFSRRFKAATGQTPFQYTVRLKLEHAARLMGEEQDSSILAVAQTVGFNNPAHFARAFRRQFGLTPRLWKSSQSTL